ncbi:MAG: rhomboid family intramembrane serine protease [Acidobacteria bacterium]|nr:rhomboid family intramembrane serine protease [Acidobacteriota bacterium]
MESCYRHPGIETGVTCQRCDRYICPECATPGAVGFLCPEDASDRVKIHRPAFQQSLVSRAPVTLTLIGINTIVYLLMIAGIPIYEMFRFMRIGQGIEYGSIWRAFTSGFVHSPYSWTHILFNMYTLYVLGTLLEPMLGKLKFILLYCICLLAGSFTFYIFGEFTASVVGASGAIFGLMGAYLIYLRSLRLDTSQMVIILLINIGISFLPGIAWQAHLGGFVFGVLVALAYTTFKDKKQQTSLVVSLALIVGLLGAMWSFGQQIMPIITNL